MPTNHMKPAGASTEAANSEAKQRMSAKIPPPAKHGWQSKAGWAKNDPLYDEAARLGAEYRRSMTWEREHVDS